MCSYRRHSQGIKLQRNSRQWRVNTYPLQSSSYVPLNSHKSSTGKRRGRKHPCEGPYIRLQQWGVCWARIWIRVGIFKLSKGKGTHILKNSLESSKRITRDLLLPFFFSIGCTWPSGGEIRYKKKGWTKSTVSYISYEKKWCLFF